MNAKRMQELDERPERATLGELAVAALASVVLLGLVFVVAACFALRVAEELGL